MRYVVAVAEDLSFSRAAQRLGVAQPTLSRSVRAFEDEHEVVLFDGTTRSVALTDAGGQWSTSPQARSSRPTRRSPRPAASHVVDHDGDRHAAPSAARRRHFAGRAPASTVVPVAKLVTASALIEIDAVAIASADS